MDSRMGVLQADMDRCVEELRFLGMEVDGKGLLSDTGSYVMIGYRGKKIAVHFIYEADKAHWPLVQEMKAFKDWVLKTSRNFNLDGVSIYGVDFFGPRVGFLKFKAHCKDDDPPPSIVFMRGGSVAIIMVIECEETGDKYTVLTKQARVPIGQEFLEIPAGMLDQNGDFVGVAAKELKEETGLKISTKQLVNISDRIRSTDPDSMGIYLSPGGCDEFMKFYAYTTRMPLAELNSLNGRLTGEIQEGEKIKLVIRRFEDIPKTIPDAKSLVAYFLYQRVFSEIPDFSQDMIVHIRDIARVWMRTGRNETDMVNYSKGVLKRDPALAHAILAAKTVTGLTDVELSALKAWAASPYAESALEQLPA
jgi:ADP-sugar diphosphatase